MARLGLSRVGTDNKTYGFRKRFVCSFDVALGEVDELRSLVRLRFSCFSSALRLGFLAPKGWRAFSPSNLSRGTASPEQEREEVEASCRAGVATRK